MNRPCIVGKNIDLYLVNIDDAEFIVDLRNKKGKCLNQIEYDINKQKEWLREYKKRESKKEEFYFLIKSKNNLKLGVVRLYDFFNGTFCWGSFIINEKAPYYVAIEVVLQIYDFAFYQLGFKESRFDVRKENKSVVMFHRRFGAKIYRESEQDYFFILTLKKYEAVKVRYKKFIQ